MTATAALSCTSQWIGFAIFVATILDVIMIVAPRTNRSPTLLPCSAWTTFYVCASNFTQNMKNSELDTFNCHWDMITCPVSS
ncbi:hypothetical protein BDR04DRAFT_1086511 [Suillus decipiens]|nr:hypothetical protein BDR04DRAFT_1086511 [Suillus decipiens]